MSERRCAFLTLEERGDFVIDDEVAIPALEAAGWRVDTVPWRQTSRPWSEFDVVVVRSTWDYWDDVPGFLRILERIDAETRLANPLNLLRWNLAKTYLRDLQAAGVTIVPTLWRDRLDAGGLAEAVDRFGTQDLVLKPQVGGNGQGVLRLPNAARSTGHIDAMDRYREELKKEGLPDDDEHCVIWAMFPQEVKKHYASKAAPAEPKQEKVEVQAPPPAPEPVAPAAPAAGPREMRLTINGTSYDAVIEEVPVD